MGIPAFFGVFIKSLNENSSRKFIITRDELKDRNIDVDVLNVDMNSLLHKAAQLTFGYGEGEDMREDVSRRFGATIRRRFADHIKEELQMLYELYNPKVIYIAVDGAAPLPKLKQQRDRRYRTLLDQPYADVGVSGFLLTPGSFLMEWVTVHLGDIVRSLELPCLTLIDGANNPGEGEQKFMNSRIGREMAYDGDNVVYGADADLILMMLVSGQGYIDRGITDNRDSIAIIDIATLFDVLANDYPVFDFIFMVMLLGNDFVPPLPMMEDVRNNFPKVLDIYKNIRSTNPQFRLINIGPENDFDFATNKDRGIVNRGNISNILELFQHLSNIEVQSMAKMGRSILRSDPLLNWFGRSSTHISEFEQRWEHRILQSGQPRSSHIIKNSSDSSNIVSNYLDALMWAFKYLTVGSKVYVDNDNEFYYILDMGFTYDYQYAPLSSMIVSEGNNVELNQDLYRHPNDPSTTMPSESLYSNLEVTNPFTSTIVCFPQLLGRHRVVTPIFQWIYDLPSIHTHRYNLFPSSFINDELTVFRDYTSKISVPSIDSTFIKEFQHEFDQRLAQESPDVQQYYHRVYSPGIIAIPQQSSENL